MQAGYGDPNNDQIAYTNPPNLNERITNGGNLSKETATASAADRTNQT
jgi:hypothetical protein